MKPGKKIDTTPFDRHREPPRQNLLAMCFFWVYCWILTRANRLKIRKVGMEGVKPPYLVLGNHLSFTDFLVTPLVLFPHRANYVSELEGFEAYGEWAYRHIGCLGTRKFVNDLALVKNIRRVLERGDILVLYPEARYCNVGTTSRIPDSVGKLAKHLGVPVVVLSMKGNYLQSPIWNLQPRKEARLEATLSLLMDAREVSAMDASRIQERIQESLRHDEYAWQQERKMAITHPLRAEGLEKVLYQCRACRELFSMASAGAHLHCTCCGARWHMTEYGKLEPVARQGAAAGNGAPIHIPDWYEWQRREVESEIAAGTYGLSMRVRIESLPNAVNFIDLGEGRLAHTPEGFALTFVEHGDTEAKTLLFPSAGMFSIHTETDYRQKGQCVTLSTLDNTYFLFPLEPGFNATRIQFATERFHQSARSRRRDTPA
ncbi:MAG TPA: lysophospholipid acyltransferase family protein [Fibrobacteria bacterium]|nr:lysophospholipid acyltransferase family protein [Fibrobacteria bacterium]